MMEARIHPDAKVAENAVVKGDVTLGKDVSVWYNAVVRGMPSKEKQGEIVIGDRTNIQDGCVLHVDEGVPLHIGEGVTVGHMVMLHGCSIGDNSLIGIGSVVLNGAKIGKNCIIGAGALVTQNAEIPDGFMAFGSPAKPVRELTEEEIEHIRKNADLYIEEANEFL